MDAKTPNAGGIQNGGDGGVPDIFYTWLPL